MWPHQVMALVYGIFWLVWMVIMFRMRNGVAFVISIAAVCFFFGTLIKEAIWGW